MDYRTLYDDYWSRPDRWGSHSFRDPQALAAGILRVCGPGAMLDVGCGMGLLVRTLVGQGLEAQGVDVAPRVVEEGNRLLPGRFHCGSILALPFADEAFPTVITTDCLEHIAEDDVPAALRELHRVCRDNVFVQLATTADRDGRWHLTIRDRSWWEARFFEAGFRKHPLLQELLPYASLEHDGRQITLVWEKLPADGARQYPLTALRVERDLHMDMLRESGRRSDAHVARYMLARDYVRPNDVVLDAACGLGYGTRILQDGSLASQVIGMDESEFAVAYARALFGAGRPTIDFRRGDVCALTCLPDESVDLVVSFETVEHLRTPEVFFREALRVLTPGGRFICSVPNRWVDDSGHDPNPYHHQVFDFAAILELCGRHFLVEQAFRQIAGGGMKLTAHPRLLHEFPLAGDPTRTEAEWWILVAMKDPVSGSKATYRETVFPTRNGAAVPNITAFGRDYENPWLVRSLISIGVRSRSPAILASLAERVLATAPARSADAGAALCVLAYQALATRAPDPVKQAALCGRLADYVQGPAGNPHAHRWIISNQYALARLRHQQGNLAGAQAAFWACAQMDCLGFSPLLGTKTVDAAFWAGWLALTRGTPAEARQCWEHGLREARRLMQSPWDEVVGDFAAPQLFGMREATQVLDCATRCANGLHWLSRNTPLPPPFIPQIFYSLQDTIQSQQRQLQELTAWSEALADGSPEPGSRDRDPGPGAATEGREAYLFLPHVGDARLVQGGPDQVAVWDASIDGLHARAIWLHPPAVLTFTLPTGARGRFLTAVAIHPDAWDRPNGGGCEFHLKVDGRLVFVVALDPAHLPGDRHWHELNLDLPESPQGPHQITLETRGMGGSTECRWALWRAPRFTWNPGAAPTP